MGGPTRPLAVHYLGLCWDLEMVWKIMTGLHSEIVMGWDLLFRWHWMNRNVDKTGGRLSKATL